MQSLIPCWELLHRSNDDRHVCPAYNGFPGALLDDSPLRGKPWGPLLPELQVYKEFFSCTSIKEKLKELV